MCLVRGDAGFSGLPQPVLFLRFFLFVRFSLLALCDRLRVAVLVPFRFLRGRLVDGLVDVLDLLPSLFLVNLALQFGELFAQLGYLLVFFFKLNTCVLTLFCIASDGNGIFPAWL